MRHDLINCRCGRIHYDPGLGIVNPHGWTTKQLGAIYAAGIIGGIAVALVLWFTL